MTFCFSIVSCGGTPLCQYCASTGNFDLFFQSQFARAQHADGLTIYRVDDFDWGVYSDRRGALFVCVVRRGTQQALLKRALHEMRTRFFRMFGDADLSSAPAFLFQAEFEPQLESICSRMEGAHAARAVRAPVETVDADELTPLTGAKDIGQRRTRGQGMGRWAMLLAALLLAVLVTFYALFAAKCGMRLNNCYEHAKG